MYYRIIYRKLLICLLSKYLSGRRKERPIAVMYCTYARVDCNKWRQLLNRCDYMLMLCSHLVKVEKVADATGRGREWAREGETVDKKLFHSHLDSDPITPVGRFVSEERAIWPDQVFHIWEPGCQGRRGLHQLSGLDQDIEVTGMVWFTSCFVKGCFFSSKAKMVWETSLGRGK